MRTRSLPIALFLVAALALFAAGCGGGGDDTTAPAETTAEEKPPVLTKAEFIAQGDAICGEVNAAVGAIGSSESEVDVQTEQVANLYVGMVENIRELGRPSETEGYGDFITAADELAAVEGEIKLATERGDVEALGEAASAAAPILEEFQAQAAVYGFEQCSEGPGAPPTTGSGSTSPEGGDEVEEGGIEAAPEVEPEIVPEEPAPEVEVAPETGGAGGGGGVEEGGAPETGGGSSGGIGPG